MTITATNATNASRTDTARALLAANPELTGAELGRALNVSDRYGRQLLHELNGTGEGKPARTLTLISFGYLHQPEQVPPPADRVEDVRKRLRDPAAARDILDLDGRDPRVQKVVLATPGAAELLDNLTAYAELPAGPRSIAVGCAGGKHRACALIQLLGERLRERGHQVTIEHRHAHLPRILKPTDDAAAPAGPVLRVPDGPLPLSIHPARTACDAHADIEPDDNPSQKAARARLVFALTLVVLVSAALGAAPTPIVAGLAVLFVVALVRYLRLALPQHRPHR